MNAPAQLLKLSGVYRRYGEGGAAVTVLKDVDLEIGRGEFVAIVGQSGSGKSTLMNIIGCLDRPTEGRYEVAGQDVADLSTDALAGLRRQTFGFIFQRYHLVPGITALGNAELPAVYAGLSGAQRRSRAEKLLGRLGLSDRLTHRPSELSGGQQQRVSIARAIMNDAQVILADEPTGALDSESGREVMGILHEMHREGRTIVIVTHAPEIAEQAERVIQIKDGVIVSDERTRPVLTGQGPGAPTPEGGMALAKVVGESFAMAMRALAHNRLRTLLTMLGIVIGVASVVAMLAIGTGARQNIMTRIEAMGTDLLLVKRGQLGVRASGREVISFVAPDIEAIAKLPGVEAVVPETTQTVLIRYGNRDGQVSALGTGRDYPAVRAWNAERGVFFTRDHERRYAQVVVIGASIAKSLFAQENPVGKYLLVDSAPFQIIGVMEAKGITTGGGMYDRDEMIWLPYSTAGTRLFGRQYFSDITVKVAPGYQLAEVEQRLRELLLRRHGKEDFHIRNMGEIIDTVNATQDTFQTLLGAIGIISLLVGGIGVMNIMLVSVTERIGEIGVRMAVGARPLDVMLQFLTESVIVCFIGGMLGVALGIGASYALTALGSGWNAVVTLEPILLAFGCAFLTGLVFGLAPARKAARLDPVAALTRE